MPLPTKPYNASSILLSTFDVLIILKLASNYKESCLRFPPIVTSIFIVQGVLEKSLPNGIPLLNEKDVLFLLGIA